MRALRFFEGTSSSEEETEENVEIEQIQRRRRIYRPRINFNFDNQEFIRRFRIYPSVAEQVLNVIGERIQHKTQMNHALSPKQQLLIALHFFGNGSQYHGVGDMHGISAPTVCRIVRRVCNAVLNVLFREFVRWPNHTANIETGFLVMADFPRVAGIVDGTLINIDAPSIDESAYVDRHGNHSLNAMVVSGPNEQFYYASAKWPGSVHDNRVMRNSTLYEKWEVQGWRPFPNAIIIGDSAYRALDWLITPNIPQDMPVRGSQTFLRRLKVTRSSVERTIGKLKMKFPCLQHLRLKSPTSCCRVILACVTLYNINCLAKINRRQRIQQVLNLGNYQQSIRSAEDTIAEIISRFEDEERP